MAAHIRWVSDNRPNELTRFWNALEPVTREKLRGVILPINWYDFADLIAVDRAIANVFGGGETSVLRDLGAWSARFNLKGVYKNFTRTSVHGFLAEGARIHATYMDFGQAIYTQTSATAGRMIHTGYTSFSPLYCESAIGYYREAVAMHGVSGASIIESTCQCCGDDSCTFVIRWR